MDATRYGAEVCYTGNDGFDRKLIIQSQNNLNKITWLAWFDGNDKEPKETSVVLTDESLLTTTLSIMDYISHKEKFKAIEDARHTV